MNIKRSLVRIVGYLCLLVLGWSNPSESSNGTPTPNHAISPDLHAKSVIVSLVAIAENSQTTPAFDYTENINDGRGITFGFIGFTTGTFDGNKWLHHYTSVNPTNRLTKYIPAMDAIDAGPHPQGKNDNVVGLEGFIDDFHASLHDAFFTQSQIEMMEELYWTASLTKARLLGIHHTITLAQIFDTSIQMGVEGMEAIASQTNSALGGPPNDAIDEILWLSTFLDARERVLSRHPAWKESVDRVNMFRRLLKTGNYALEPPFHVTCYDCAFTVTGVGILP